MPMTAFIGARISWLIVARNAALAAAAPNASRAARATASAAASRSAVVCLRAVTSTLMPHVAYTLPAWSRSGSRTDSYVITCPSGRVTTSSQRTSPSRARRSFTRQAGLTTSCISSSVHPMIWSSVRARALCSLEFASRYRPSRSLT